VHLLRAATFGGFFICVAVALVLVLRMLDNRRGQQISALRVFFFPFFLPPAGFNERGRALDATFLKVWGVAFAFWAVSLLVTVFAP